MLTVSGSTKARKGSAQAPVPRMQGFLPKNARADKPVPLGDGKVLAGPPIPRRRGCLPNKNTGAEEAALLGGAKEASAGGNGVPLAHMPAHWRFKGVTLLCKTSLRTNSSHFRQSLDSSRPSDLLAQGLLALGIVLFSCLSYMTLNYICSYLYTHLYNVARFPSLYIDLAPSPHSLPSNIIVRSVSSLEGWKEADGRTLAWAERPGGRRITDSYT